MVVLTAAFPFPDRVDQPSLPVIRNYAKLSNSSCDGMQPTDLGYSSSEQLHADVVNTSSLYIPQLCHNLSDLRQVKVGFH